MNHSTSHFPGISYALIVGLLASGDFISVFSPFSFRHALALGLKEKLPLLSIVANSTVTLLNICLDLGWGQARRLFLEVLIKTYLSNVSLSL